MRLKQAPILRLYKLETDPKDHQKYVQAGKDNMITSIQDESGTLFMQTGHEDEGTNYVFECYQDLDQYNVHVNSPQYKAFAETVAKILTNRVKVELQPEFIATSSEKIATVEPADYVAYLTEIGVGFDKGDEFAHGVLKEMEAAVKQEDDILTMIAGTVNDQPNEWLSLEVYKSEEAYEKHTETSYFKNYLKETKYCVESKALHKIKPDVLASQGEILYRP
ncbi:antibiotic biosynthesis monooxygenase [uncultured Lactobacillus sp.]|mgnify:CR=1 FL=1|uniref:putative quinol monooxygenase n=1 Tax=uncultured Lactobacillus sp. TaxID=153152 RepID=UPI00280415D3|nr:antibiotic biosynthesis monooxygenase [uncultured Lactobacillus sp.]